MPANIKNKTVPEAIKILFTHNQYSCIIFYSDFIMENFKNDAALTENNLEEHINNFEIDLNEIINNIKSNSGDNIEKVKEQLINKTKNIMTNLYFSNFF